MFRRILFLLLFSVMSTQGLAQTLYRYKDDSGAWQFTDKPPADQRETQSERLVTRNRTPQVVITQESITNGTRLVARNEWHCPMELVIKFSNAKNLDPDLGKGFETVLAPDSTVDLLDIIPYDITQSFGFEMEYSYLHVDPATATSSGYLYALPYARGTEYAVSQAFPTRITHRDKTSRHAIDFAMPEGTPVFAARDGVVFATAYEHFSGGSDRARDLPKANVVRIAHDDGTMAIYAHLSWNAIRVKPGQKVKRGQYIADSGNTGYSSGPHLHFAVLENTGMSITSVPVVFSGPGNNGMRPQTGLTLLNIE